MKNLEATGLLGLTKALAIQVPECHVQSFRGASQRKTIDEPTGRREYYRSAYGGDGSPRAMLRFALKYEPLDLGVLVPVLRALGGEVVRDWVRDEPTSAFARRAWFLYERFVGVTLDLDNALRNLPPASALNSKLQVTLGDRASKVSARHRVRDNLLGGPEFCPLIRRTRVIEGVNGAALRAEIGSVARDMDADRVERAVRWLQTEETRSTFEIEGDEGRGNRAQRFLLALQQRSEFPLDADEAAFATLQRSFVDPRYADEGWRRTQVFVARNAMLDEFDVSYVCPKPGDLPPLMEGWRAMTARALRPGGLDPVIAAALVAFGFVFIHPFEDGNGRIHRFLLHRVFDELGLTEGLLLPVSAVILQRLPAYHRALQAVSRTLMPLIAWERHTRDGRGALEVQNPTHDLYRFLDLTPVTEFTWDVVAETVRTEVPRELRWVVVYDRALRGVQDYLDLPDREASLFVRLCLQNNGALSARKRAHFSRLTDDEIAAMEAIVREAQSMP